MIVAALASYLPARRATRIDRSPLCGKNEILVTR
jgi:hypothetical protein